jgi:hypothetical protein
MKTGIRLLLLSVIFTITSTEALGWNRRGHLIVAAVAYVRLQQNDTETLDEINDILKQHPRSHGGKRSTMPLRIFTVLSPAKHITSCELPRGQMISDPQKVILNIAQLGITLTFL